MQYHMIQCNYMYKTMQYHKTQLNSMQYHTMDAMQYNGIICIFGPKNSHFWQLGPYNSLPTGQTATYWKTEGVRSYDPIESDL